MLSAIEFMERDQERWERLFAEDDYRADMQLQQEYNDYCNEPRLNLEFVCNCVSPSEDIGGLRGLEYIIENMEEIDSDGIEANSLRDYWGDDVGNYATSIHRVSLNNENYLVFVHSAIENIYKIAS